MAPRWLPVGLALLLPLACDKGRTDDELRTMMGEVAETHVATLQKKVDELDKKNGELSKANDALQTQVKGLEDEIVKLTPLVTELDAELVDMVKRVDDLEAKAVAPTPSVLPGRPDPADTFKVPLADAPTRGKDTALVTIVIFSDFQCPYCKRVVPTLEALESQYGSDLRLAFRHNPLSFHTSAMPAARAAMAAHEQGKFWEMHDKLFENQKDLTEANFNKWARELGLDVKRFKKDYADAAIERKIKDDQSAGITLGARGTPAFFVNGRFVSGAQPKESFEKVIDEELTKAKALVAAGTPRDGVYAATIASGKTEP